MAHKWFVCPDELMATVDDRGEVSNLVEIHDCLTCSVSRANRACQWDFADLTLRLDRSATYASFTPSKMLGCDKELWFKQHVDYAVNPEHRNAMVRGTRAHSALEVPHPNIIGEVTVVRYLDVPWQGRVLRLPITVRPDKVYPFLGLIHDDKTRAYLQTTNKLPVAPPYAPDYAFQLSVGAWAWGQPAFTIDGHGVHVDPPAIAVTTGQITYRDSTKQIRVPYELLDFDVLEGVMRARCQDLLRIYDLDAEPGPLVGDDQWKCKTCPFLPANGGACNVGMPMIPVMPIADEAIPQYKSPEIVPTGNLTFAGPKPSQLPGRKERAAYRSQTADAIKVIRRDTRAKVRIIK